MIAFTICSNNYLAQAITLAESLKKYEPNIIFKIGLVDILNYDTEINYDVIEIDKIGIPADIFKNLCDKYNIVELSTSVKPFYFEYLFHKFPEINQILYLDPDLFFFNNLNLIKDSLNNFSVVITPHILNPTKIEEIDWEFNLLKYGLYNFGFIGFARSNESFIILDWWKQRTIYYGFDNTLKAMFTDQIWGTLMPLFFNNILIIKHFGLNVAYWNLHERNITFKNNYFFINEQYELVFYHFSSFDPLNNNQIAKNQNFPSIKINSAISKIYEIYTTSLLKNGYNFYSKKVCFYLTRKKMYKEKVFKRKLSLFFKK